MVVPNENPAHESGAARRRPSAANASKAGSLGGLQSVITFKNSQGEDARGTLLRLSRSAVIFEVYNPYSIVQLSEILQGLRIRRGERVIYDGRAVVHNLVNTGLLLIVSVTLIDPWQDLNQLYGDGEGLRAEIDRFVGDWRGANILNDDYRLAVNNLRSFLGQLNRWLEQTDMVASADAAPAAGRHDDEFFVELARGLAAPLHERFEEFESAARNVDPEETVRYQSYSQNDIHALVMPAPFMHRTFNKPLGYAGDYEMINMIYRNRPEGTNTYGRLIHYLFLQRPIALSVRNRSDQLLTMLKAETARRAEQTDQTTPINILTVGCGPAFEIQRFLRASDLGNRCHFHLMDFSETTLDHAMQRLGEVREETGVHPELTRIHESIHQLLKDATRVKTGTRGDQFDIIYCAGLFDYLSDKVCGRVIRLFYRWLRPGGLVFVTNMRVGNEDRFTMEHLAEWHLIYRDEACMGSLVPGLGEQKMYTDETLLNLILEVRKPADLEATDSP
ncbi:MAG: class I SAM-dependent methyltransferase [Gammaproteobacteria bacterium]